MSEYDYEKAYWDVRRKLVDLKTTLVVFVAILLTYLIRYFLLGSFELYLKAVMAWEIIDWIVMIFIFFSLAALIRKILDINYSLDKIIP